MKVFMIHFFVETIVIDNGKFEVAIVSIDLLIFPPLLRNKLVSHFNQKQTNLKFYFSASHTHTGFGGWDDSPIGGLAMGGFQEEVLDELTTKVIETIENAQKNKVEAKLSYTQLNTGELLENRLDKQSAVDNWLRVLKINRTDNKRAVLFSYAAHATNINKDIYQLSGDYPNHLLQQLEGNSNVDFGLFCAGMVGSHRFKWRKEKDFEKV